MNNKILWLRVSYWAGAIADVLFAILCLIPERMGEIEYIYPMGLAFSAIFSWTFILIWADRKPIERKGILLPTILVASLIIITGLHAVYSNIIPLGIPNLLLGVVLIILWSFSYYNARDIEQ
ncbi:hypothetical protein J7W08_03515 [Methanococcoides orientis]|uniref:hypothetical protein n=1 Tax=Methanococcoides orientis TaxID=2822137 RepID=UPI001E5876BF|nr:hypothetical protein [Methanococcoides orientis]UGV41378.1 hypothetical protein J7W08_03515 [Methanococcoides orientis]